MQRALESEKIALSQSSKQSAVQFWNRASLHLKPSPLGQTTISWSALQVSAGFNGGGAATFMSRQTGLPSLYRLPRYVELQNSVALLPGEQEGTPGGQYKGFVQQLHWYQYLS